MMQTSPLQVMNGVWPPDQATKSFIIQNVRMFAGMYVYLFAKDLQILCQSSLTTFCLILAQTTFETTAYARCMRILERGLHAHVHTPSVKV